jgi:hypothetical protein
MISRLNSFQSLHPKEKILWAMATLTDFDKFYQAALASKIKLQDYFDRIAHQAPPSTKDMANPPEITPEQDGLEAIVLKPSLHLGLSS